MRRGDPSFGDLNSATFVFVNWFSPGRIVPPSWADHNSKVFGAVCDGELRPFWHNAGYVLPDLLDALFRDGPAQWYNHALAWFKCKPRDAFEFFERTVDGDKLGNVCEQGANVICESARDRTSQASFEKSQERVENKEETCV